MRSALPGLAISASLVALTMAAGCANAKAQAALPDATPLTIPQAPPRVVVPPAPDPPPAPPEAPPASSTSTAANPPASSGRSTRETRPVTPPPQPATPPATPPPAPTSPATPLETQANQSELEKKTSDLLASAEAALLKINRATLTGDGKAQWDAANSFVTQAKAALKVKNVVYAWQLADKANTIATLLLRHS
jgi:hypothetical protein